MDPEKRQPSQKKAEITPETTAEISLSATFDEKTWKQQVKARIAILVKASGGKLLAHYDEKKHLIVDDNTLISCLRHFERCQPSRELLSTAGALLAADGFWMTRGRPGISLQWLFSPKHDHFGELLSYAAAPPESKSGESDQAIGGIG